MTTDNDRTGEYVFDLYKDGAYFKQTSITSGFKTARDALVSLRKKGYRVAVVRQPKGAKIQ